MKKKVKKMFFKALIVILIVMVTLLVVWFLISNGKIREYKDENGNIIEGSLSEKSIVEINGVKNGFFINSRDTSNPVLLLISSGPGTDDYFLTERFDDMHLDDIFTVVYWDYRGMGIVYDRDIDPASITEDVLLDDTKAVTDYLKSRFNKEKIYLMGFSGGSRIGISAAEKYPEDYYAYIGMAQVVTDSTDRDKLMYDFMKSEFEKRNDKARLRKLESSVTKTDEEIKCNDWYSFVYLLHDAGGGTIHNETEFEGIDIPIILSHCYTVPEKINYIRGMKMYKNSAFEAKKDYDYREEKIEFEIPIYFLSGEYDYNCPWPLVEDYCEKINAPDKGFYKISGAAHSPLWENTEESFKIMSEIKEKTYER